MEKSRFFIVLIFVTAIPIIISKNVKNSVMTTLTKGVISETSNGLGRGISEEVRKNVDYLGILTSNISESEFKRFLGHFNFFKGIAILNKRGERELSVGLELASKDHDKKIIKDALTFGRRKVFFTISNSSRIFMNILYPYKTKDTNEWKCIHAVADCTNIIASYTRPVKEPMAIFKYVYDSENEIILPSFSNVSIGISLIPYMTRNLSMGQINGVKYFLHRKKIKFRKTENIDVVGIHAFIVVPKSFMNHLMREYRIVTNAMLIGIFSILAIIFFGIFRSYSSMENKLTMYRGVIEDAGIAVVVVSIRNMKVVYSNKIARNVFYIDEGHDLRYFISKESERTYVNNVLFTTGSVYNYKVGIKAKYNEELTVVLSLGVNTVRQEAVMTFFEEAAMISKQSAVTEVVKKRADNNKSSIIDSVYGFFARKIALSKKADEILQKSKQIIANSQNNNEQGDQEQHVKEKTDSAQGDEANFLKLVFIKLVKIDYSGIIYKLLKVISNFCGCKRFRDNDDVRGVNDENVNTSVIRRVKPKMKVRVEPKDEVEQNRVITQSDSKTGPQDGTK